MNLYLFVHFPTAENVVVKLEIASQACGCVAHAELRRREKELYTTPSSMDLVLDIDVN